MGFCPRCGANTLDHSTVCNACGNTLTQTPASAPNAQQRAVGTTREPWVVLVLTLVTLGIYAIVFWWRASKEVDAYTMQPDHAHGKVRMGFFIGLGAMGAVFIGFIFLVGGIAGAAVSGGADAPTAASGFGAIGALGILVFVGAAGLAIAAAILMYMGYWRVWTAIQQDERARNQTNPISPGLMLAFFIIPYLNFVTMWIALHRTQKGLNGMWNATRKETPAMPAY